MASVLRQSASRVLAWWVFAGGIAAVGTPGSALAAGVACGWTTLVPDQDTTGNAAPKGRLGHTAVIDSAAARLVVFGGDGPEDAVEYRTKSDAWTLSLGDTPSWTLLPQNGTPPRDRRAHTAIWDAPRQRMIVFGGIGFDSARTRFWPDDSAAVYALENLDADPRWTLLETPPAPWSRRYAHATALDPARERMWVYGGATQFSGIAWSAQLAYFDLATAAWALATPPPGPAPPGLVEHVLVHDPARDRLLLFGGLQAGTAAPMRDVWQLTLSGAPAWSMIPTTGTPPTETTNIRGVYDPDGDQLVIVGPSSVQALVLGDTSTWRPARAHPTRYGPAVAYDAPRARVLALAGELDGGAMPNDVLATAAPPVVKWSVFPKKAGRVDVEYHGGCPETATLTARANHGWDFVSWSGAASDTVTPLTIALDSTSTVLATFEVSTATLVSRFDAVRTASGVALRWGFGDPSRVTATNVERRRSGESAWRALALATRAERDGWSALDAEPGHEGEAEYRLRVSLQGGEEVLVGPVRAGATAASLATTIESVAPNPSWGRAKIAFTLAVSGPVTLAVLDVQGREVARLVHGVQSAGRYEVSWDTATGGHRLPAGVYFARLRAGAAEAVHRLVVAD